MNETVTVTLHGEQDTTVKSQRFHVDGQGWFTSIEIGAVSILAPVNLLRRIADEATKAALIAEGWSAPAVAPPAPPVFKSGALEGMPIPGSPPEAGSATTTTEVPF